MYVANHHKCHANRFSELIYYYSTEQLHNKSWGSSLSIIYRVAATLFILEKFSDWENLSPSVLLELIERASERFIFLLFRFYYASHISMNMQYKGQTPYYGIAIHMYKPEFSVRLCFPFRYSSSEMNTFSFISSRPRLPKTSLVTSISWTTWLRWPLI